MSPQITLITKAGQNALMSKRISLDAQGAVRSDGSQCVMARGTATRASAATAASLAEIIRRCSSHQAIALGALKSELPDTVPIVTQRMLKNNADAISRTREFIDYPPGEPGWALIDVDKKGMPASVAARIEAVGGVWEALRAVAPGLAQAARVSRPSTSAGLSRSDTGAQFAGSGGFHVYVLAKDGGDIKRCLPDLHDRCWLHGLGWYGIGAAGQLLERSLVDRMVAYGERLCFEGAPLIEPPLAQDPAKRIPEAFEGEAIDTLLVVPPLTQYERHLVNEAKTASAKALGSAAAEVRTQHDRALAERISARTGMPLASAARTVSARHRGVLQPHVELDFDDLGTVPVADVLADPDRFVGETLADPLEGVDYGRCKAMVMRADDGRLFIHSFAHGRTLYEIRHDARSAQAAVAQAPAGAVVDHAMAVLANADLEADEVAEFASSVAKVAGVGVRAVTARITKERKEREQAERKAAAASHADGRIVRPRPAPDGELTPTVEFIDETLAADTREEPPMRDASGNLVEVRQREPWNMHQLTADGTNDDADDVEAMKAPAEPLLGSLTPTGVELMIEQHIAWRVERTDSSYFGALPRAHIDALMQFPRSAIPVARAINTTPLVTVSGKVIDGVGLDRNTGLVHRIDPLLRVCLPVNPPTPQDVQDAMAFLLDEWLVDVALGPEGRCIAIMLALTLIERTLLPERPAFFVAAPQRGGGKTTLVHMVTQAVLGRKAAAAGWSQSEEERRKALFSYLRQGVAALAWDNIARGSAISCPHIEAALTASDTTDRVLGVSRVETAASTTVQIFTGNSITPRGDMASRSLIMALSVDRPDPENRKFAHEDPLAWTQAHRIEIVKALYTILVAGALNRPQGQVAKTRFKTWWQLVGWPVEYAASLLGINVDCTELLRLGEVGDEEASAASAALSALRGVFGIRAFTARDAVKAMTRERNPYTRSDDDEAEQARADAIAEALGEVAGKRLDHPTAHSIGKLFQRCLVDRPTFVGDGQATAVLRKTVGHNENRYRVEVVTQVQSPAGAAANSGSSADPGENIPHNPTIPRIRPLVRGVSGNGGKAGNVPAAGAADAAFPPEDDADAPRWELEV